ncbi:hypothetical protein PHYBLDRAFT_58397 [Phycomyces blakesleeanus NRRL 1555(-)]|uniref:Uncharacterized protein n=1 Tax=Phycomyces blakesleeanus (strain ATCC 8743b / DSM 1359 / FGSC 10004 / NBRC 33097 / NRRL 1555) TaxID=763407 RepID=A0A167QA08_PHYB8|nr:hypothetical protein PHYBLDRAFT_58397 [Phycomyces blakesleeanus NRRL 1555(-)]OAD79347.1 hypothetical protein PHYBLDRAFT_58397 [Phycomyces blakesleeanus NRRL 1555(-)]|eukprot:XP_018297387.1 hypothetical protein PHYBLDRAFT_58397 [Phycomyces blakesleeanus NRRL 1555(-)]
MLQLLLTNCMQSLPAELVTFLTSMQSQFNALNECTEHLESLAAKNVQLHAQLANVQQENANLRFQLLQNNHCKKMPDSHTFSNNRPWIVDIWSGHLIQTFNIGSLFCILGFGFLILGTAILL